MKQWPRWGRSKRARGAKSDRLDAIGAARQALARNNQGAPRAGGLRETLRMVFACGEGVLASRTKAINELKALIVVAPDQLRAQLRGCSLAVQLTLNRALHTVTITRMRCHPETRAYEIRRSTEGKTHREIRRSVKRALARSLYRRIEAAVRAHEAPIAA